MIHGISLIESFQPNHHNNQRGQSNPNRHSHLIQLTFLLSLKGGIFNDEQIILKNTIEFHFWERNHNILLELPGARLIIGKRTKT